MIKLAIHWQRFGPYHLARLKAAYHKLKSRGVYVVGLETASQDKTYRWEPIDEATSFERFIVFPNTIFEQIRPLQMWGKMHSVLEFVNPDVVALCGYSTHDVWSALAWCRYRGRAAVLMSESKADDAPRLRIKEWVKGRIIKQFAAALAGGSSQKAYLEQLGMRSEQISLGYDVVDNDYFRCEAQRSRQNPTSYQHLPGLETTTPFFLASARFVRRKNLDGLLRAYQNYRKRLGVSSENKPWRLVLLGDGEERDTLEKLVSEEKIEGVSFPGFQQIEVLPAYYGLASTFIHPALQEQWGLVVNEAMAAGLPVLVSNRCGCVPDLVRESVNGFTFDPTALDSLTDLMILVSSNRVDLPIMGLASQMRISQWGVNRFAQGLYKALEVALS